MASTDSRKHDRAGRKLPAATFAGEAVGATPAGVLELASRLSGDPGRLAALVEGLTARGLHLFVAWRPDVPADGEVAGSIEHAWAALTQNRGRVWHDPDPDLDIIIAAGEPGSALLRGGAKGRWFGHRAEWQADE